MDGRDGAESALTDEMIMNCIYVVRGQKVMIDVDLAGLYQIDPTELTEEVKMNSSRFPEDLIFELNDDDFCSLWKQNVSLAKTINRREVRIAFTERAIPMLAGIIDSDMVLKVNCRIIQIFYHIRQILDHYLDIRLE